MSGIKHGKDTNLGGTSTVNAFKMLIEAQTAAPPPIPVFRPLTSWPVKPHDRQAEIDAFKAIRSRYK